MKSEFFQKSKTGSSVRLSRRDLFKGTGLAALTGLAGCSEPSESPTLTREFNIPVPTY
ncbi:MAG: hypothetical protein HOC71_15900, partial [Candidatus Latescibacteria bacterium]|nr:hypothetical protein [Candidatus Latescibacterota bacterium]